MNLRAIWIPLCAAACSCVSTPIPQPPPESLDIGKIVLPEVWPATNAFSFSGAPGAAPPGSHLRVTNLDNTEPPVEVVVASDGSFSVTLAFDAAHELRMQIVTDEERQPPIDVVLGNGVFVPSPRIDCFTAPLEVDMGSLAVDDTSQAAITLDNTCSDDAQITASFFRTNDPAFAFVGPPPSVLVAGDGVDVEVTFRPASAGDAEEIALITVTVAGTDARYPVTLFGLGE